MNRKLKLLLLHCLLLLHFSQRTSSQSLAKSNSNGLGLTEEDAEEIERKRTQNVVKLAATDQLNSEIITNRTRAYLSCESGEMIVKINFSEPFRGVGYSDYDRTSPCKFYGDGGRYYEMRLPLKGCGTKQEAPRLFINNIILRFHRSLELEEDEIKTIICRYPPPLAPPPPSISAPILEPTPPPAVIIPAKLSEVELLLIISALLFLTLLLLGIGIAYYCLKRRNIKVIRKRKVLSSGPPSEITKISHSTFEPIRIPRVTAVSSSGSETLVSSDYPSESPSSDERRSVVSETSTIRHDHYKYENSAFVPEPYPMDIEKEESVTSLAVPVIAKPNITKLDLLTTIRETEHLTDTDVFNTKHSRTTTKLYKKLPPVFAKIKRKPASIPDNDNRSASEYTEDVPMRAPSLSSTAPSLYGSIPDNDNWSHSELEEGPQRRPYVKPPNYSVSNVDDYFINTQHITDVDEDITRHRRTTHPKPKITTQTIDDYYISPKETTDITEDTTTTRVTTYPKPQITTRTTDDYYISPQETTDITEDTTTTRVTTYPKPQITTRTTDDYYVSPRETTDITEDTSTKRVTTYPKPKITTQGVDDYYVDNRETTDVTEDTTTRKVKSFPPPKVTKQTVDDYYLDNRETTEITDDTSTKKLVKYPKPKITVHNIDETFITNISETETTQHVIKSDKSQPPPPPTHRLLPSTEPKRLKPSGPDWDVTIRHYPIGPTKELPETKTQTIETWDKYISDQLTSDQIKESTSFGQTSIQYPPRRPPKFDVIIRVIDAPPPVEGVERLTPEVKHKLRTVITTDEIFRTLIIESTTVEEYIYISRDIRYEKLFEPPTWEVIIRILTLPEVLSAPLMPEPSDTETRPPHRYRKGDPRRKSSLPSISGEPIPFEPTHGPGSIRSRRTSRSGSIFDNDVRSLTEEDVTFARPDRDYLRSPDTGYPRMSRYLEDVPIYPSTRPYISRTTHISDRYVVPPLRSYSPDIDALSLAIPTTYTPRYASTSSYLHGRSSYERSAQLRQTLDRTSSVGEKEETKSLTETDVYDWLRR